MKFTDSQLNDIRRLFNQIATETYGLEREALEATKFIPAQGGLSPWLTSWAYKTVSEVGMAKFIADYADDIPPVARLMKLETVGIKTIADAYAYSEFELQQWLTAGIDVSRDDAETARRKIDEKVDEVLLVGDTEQGITGLFNNANVTVVSVASNSGKTSTKWKDKTLDEIVADVNAIIDSGYALNKGAIVLDSIILPHEAFAHIATTRVSQYDGSILDYLKKLFAAQGIVNWNESRKLTGRAVAYKKAPSVLAYVLPEPFRQKEPQAHALHYKVPCYARIGGTVIKNLKGIVYADGV